MCFWIALIILLFALIGSYPAYPYSREWGYYPSGAALALLLILLFLWWFMWLPGFFY